GQVERLEGRERLCATDGVQPDVARGVARQGQRATALQGFDERRRAGARDLVAADVQGDERGQAEREGGCEDAGAFVAEAAANGEAKDAREGVGGRERR